MRVEDPTRRTVPGIGGIPMRITIHGTRSVEIRQNPSALYDVATQETRPCRAVRGIPSMPTRRNRCVLVDLTRMKFPRWRGPGTLVSRPRPNLPQLLGHTKAVLTILTRQTTTLTKGAVPGIHLMPIGEPLPDGVGQIRTKVQG